MVHDINPIIFSIGPISVAWYGLCYVISFIIGYFFVRKNLKKKNVVISNDHYESFIFCIILGVIIGGRFGYVLFYQLSYYLQNPLHIFYVWNGGMSFHGGMIGVIISALIFCKKNKYDFYTLADPSMPLVAIGIGIVRMANFINGELYGKYTTLPWAVIFKRTDPLMLPRHPSQIYEAILEGFLMAILLQFILFKTNLKGMIFWLFIGLYGVVRFLIEFIRIPDDLPIYKNGMIFGFFSMGQFFSLLMILTAGVFLFIITRKK